ncbi:pyrethroid hydrolase Ces2a-like [Scylla paramamosain]|uniref:pyrethroid hydrolase Ces2a-like n=1 Tax=Scylla paramamosain TaxID=85552 RepID=UPI0030836FB3
MLLLLCAAVCVGAGVAGVEVEVKVAGGVVKGVERESERGRIYHAFLGIPYARAPVDRLRFMPPQAAEGWEGTLDATHPRQPCAQAALGIMEGVEDCLYLFVYTPKKQNGSLPVVVWLHGGAFVVGGGVPEREPTDGPKCCTGGAAIQTRPTGLFPHALRHQRGQHGRPGPGVGAALGTGEHTRLRGDRGRVTLAGDCAGGASAVYHMLSPLSVGLFHRVISFSGAPLTPWALYTHNHRFLLILANYVKCPAHDQKLTVKCFQELGVDELLHPVQMMCEARDPLVGNHRLSPVVQDPERTPAESLFLPHHPLIPLTNGPLPGTRTDESD